MSDTQIIAPPEQKEVVLVLEVSARILSILAGFAVGILGHDWTAAAVVIAAGNGGASVGAKAPAVKNTIMALFRK